ncbi:MAG: AmmeMemoRadiSam system protein A [Candidatus Cloacimonetes bacterium]|nr:AmmeMemoRadiSam system protein A [Candidatus Cloacimonadota bacterium]
MLTNEEKKLSLSIAREAIAEQLGLIGKMLPCPLESVFTESYGLFVSLSRKGHLRGCIGYIEPYKPLYQSLVDLSRAAAFKDNRFKPVNKEEFPDINIEISILSPLYKVIQYEEIVIGRDGLYIKHPRGSGLLLPQVATKYNWDRDTFLIETCHKAGLHESCLSDEKLIIFRFEALIFSDNM